MASYPPFEGEPMKKLIIALALAVPLVAAADDLNCSLKAKKLTSKKDMISMAKVSESDARKRALDSVNVQGATISSGGLEVEDGCLIYDYDVKIAGKSGVQEVMVDAGNGKIIKTEHESVVSEAAGKVKTKAVELKDKVTTK
jgi:uncharacterized membrane protein YkoI